MLNVHSNADGQDDRDGTASLCTALSYAERGWPVFPCHAEGERRKQPTTRHGVKDATTDPAKIRSRWTRGGWFRPGNYLVGVATGAESGIAVLDIDVKRADANGFKSLAKLGYPDRIATLTARTASGGEHLYFKCPAEGIGCTTGEDGRGIGPGLDWRGDGGYVIAPSPGSGYEWYEWAEDLRPADVPADLMPRATRPHSDSSAAQGDPVSLATLRDVLAWIDPGASRNKWRDCVAAISNTPLIEGDEEDDLREVAHEWSEGKLDRLNHGEPTNYTGPGAVDTVLDTMPPRPDGVGLGTLVMYAREEGYQGAVDSDEAAISAKALSVWKTDIVVKTHGGAQPAVIVSANPAGPWPEPIDVLDGELTAAPTLTRDMLPHVIADFAADEAARKGVTLATVAFPALAVCASAISDDLKIQPRQRDTGWLESARLWLALVAPSGIKKSPSLNAAKAPLAAIEEIERLNFREAKKRHDALTKEQKEMITEQGGSLAAPIEKRYIVNDSTTEQLAHILAVNPQGLLFFRDELSGMIESFDAYRANGQGKDRAAFLEAWNGGSYSVDRRAVDGTVHVPNWSFSILGGIQPDRMRKIITKSDLQDDGFLQRFLLVPGENDGLGIDQVPNQVAIDRYAKTLEALAKLVLPAPVTLSPEARGYFTDLEKQVEFLCDLPTTPGALAAWLRKLPGQYTRMLLTCHLIGQVSSPVGVSTVVPVETARRVYALFNRFLLPVAIRVYGEWFATKGTVIDTMRRIAGHILARRLDRITLRDLRDNLHLKANADKEIRDATDKLDLAGWVRANEPKRRDSTSWSVNSLVHDRFVERAAQERQRREELRQRITEAGEERRRHRDERDGASS